MNNKRTTATRTPSAAWGRALKAAICALAALELPAAVRADTETAEPDAFLEYVEATGSQYIDTGVNAETGLKARIDMEWGDGGTSCDWGFLGAKDNTLSSENKKRLFLYHGNYYSGMFRVAYGYGDFGRPAHSPGYNKRHEIVSDFTDNSAIQIQLNGTNTIQAADQTSRAANGPLNLGINLYLFAINLKDSSHPNGAPANFGQGKLYELKIWKKNAQSGELDLIRHYLPCIKGGRAGLYDKVNGTISYSDGSSDFVPGNVLPPPAALVEWVEASGTMVSSVAQQYVDTHVWGKLGLKSRVDVTLLESSGDHAILAARGSGSSTNYRLYMAYHYNGYFCYGDGKLREPKLADAKPVSGTRYLIESDLSASGQSVKVNGTELNNGTFTGTSYFATGNTLALFANNHNGAYVKTPTHSRLYSAKIWDGDELLRDFVPCVATNGAAGLYDTVSERVFFPETTAFDPATQVGVITNVLREAAAPKTRIEYVESDGTSDFVNLGVIGKDGVEMDTVMEWVTVPSDGAFVGSRNESPSVVRFFPYHHWPKAGYNAHRIGYAEALNGAGGEEVVATAGRKYRISSRLDYRDRSISVQYKDGDSWAWEGTVGGQSISDSNGPIDTGLPLYLFAVNSDGKPKYFGASRVYSLKLRVKQDGGTYAPVRDLVPVIDPVTGGGALWDKVSETYFRNAGKYLLAGGGAEREMEIPFVLTVR
jgi:hypothetical protein